MKPSLLLAVLAVAFAGSQAEARERERTLQLKQEAACQVHAAAIDAAYRPPEIWWDPSSTGASEELPQDPRFVRPYGPERPTRIEERAPPAPKCPGGTLYRRPPQYPPDTRVMGVAPYACAILRYDVDADGRPQNATLIHRIPEGEGIVLRQFEDLAMSALSTWCYPPYIENGQAKAQQGLITEIRYQLAVPPLGWEMAKTEKEYAKRASKMETLSRGACGEFPKLLAKYSGDAGTANPDSPFTEDAVPIDRPAPAWPAAISPGLLNHVCVFVRFDVDESGRPDKIDVLFQAPSHDNLMPFELAAAESVLAWRYRPATRDGVPVRRPDVVTEVTFVVAPEAN